MSFDTTQQTDYLINLLGARRDKISRQIDDLEKTFTDMVALHANVTFKKLEDERDLNATLTVRLMNEEIQMKREVRALSN